MRRTAHKINVSSTNENTPMPKHSEQHPADAPERASASSEEYASSGVDRSLIRWMLSLSPTERLLAIQQQVNAVQQMKEQIDSD